MRDYLVITTGNNHAPNLYSTIVEAENENDAIVKTIEKWKPNIHRPVAIASRGPDRKGHNRFTALERVEPTSVYQVTSYIRAEELGL